MDETEHFKRLYFAIEHKEPVAEITALAVDQQMFSARKWKTTWVSNSVYFDRVKRINLKLR